MGCGAPSFDLVTCRQTTFDFLLVPIQILPMRGGFSRRKERNAHRIMHKTSSGNIGTSFAYVGDDEQAMAIRQYVYSTYAFES